MKFPLSRAIAWVLFLLAVYACAVAFQSWENPFAKAVSPVLSSLPKDAPGCGEKCK